MKVEKCYIFGEIIADDKEMLSHVLLGITHSVKSNLRCRFNLQDALRENSEVRGLFEIITKDLNREGF